MQNCIILHCWRVPRGRLEQSRGTAGRTGAIDGCSYYQPIPAAQVNMFLEMRDKRYIYKLKLYVHVLPYQRHTLFFSIIFGVNLSFISQNYPNFIQNR